jgi:hypothetical protein
VWPLPADHFGGTGDFTIDVAVDPTMPIRYATG